VIAVSAQISLYPLGQRDLGPAIQDVLGVLSQHGIAHQVGAMSTLAWGEDGTLFPALQEAFARVAERGAVVMVLTVSNACPLPGAEGRLPDDG
jgi:uncharacterized protein YqgV (UPF0045/DUF77 family)